MKATGYIISTLRENPQDAQVTSHRLMMRSGLIRKLGSGLYHLMPTGLRTIRKIEQIVREEMNNAGALEFQLPILTPAEIWETSGRWETMGKEMFRIKDRHESWNVLGPTHEESFTELMKGILHSYRDLPVNVYQIHTKFRDEIRPRFGVIRSREFIMKDAYSFDMDDESLDVTYKKMKRAYRRIFARLGLHTIPVEADTGTMGGSASEEFMVPSEIGEETLLLSDSSDYRGNQEKTPCLYDDKGGLPTDTKKERVKTPDMKTIEEVAGFLEVDIKATVKAIALNVDGRHVIVFIRGDRILNEVKLQNHLGAGEVLPAGDEELSKMGVVAGFIGPDGIGADVEIVYDRSLTTGSHWVVGANEKDYHTVGYKFPDSLATHDVASAVSGDPSPDGNGRLTEVKGIEVGHIFKLGHKYTKAFELSVLDENGRSVTPTMGCYGIGINRSVAAIIEQNCDDKGIIWPISTAPFEVSLVTIAKKEEELKKAEEVYEALCDAGIEVLWDNRNERPGVKFADAELLGFPIRVTLGKGFYEKGLAEIQLRSEGKNEEVAGGASEVVSHVLKLKNSLIAELQSKLGEIDNI